jgi:hypothetical protein
MVDPTDWLELRRWVKDPFLLAEADGGIIFENKYNFILNYALPDDLSSASLHD